MSAYEKMSYALVAVTIIPYIIGLVIEPRVTKYYKVLHIYGRVYAMISSFGLFTIVYSVIYIAALIIDGKMTKVDLEVGLLFFAVGCVVTIPLYLRVYKKSPDFMKKRCLWDLTVSGFGAMARLVFWFAMFVVRTWWEVSKPDVYSLDNGLEVYVFPDGMVYDANQGRFGKFNQGSMGEKSTVTWNS